MHRRAQWRGQDDAHGCHHGKDAARVGERFASRAGTSRDCPEHAIVGPWIGREVPATYSCSRTITVFRESSNPHGKHGSKGVWKALFGGLSAEKRQAIEKNARAYRGLRRASRARRAGLLSHGQKQWLEIRHAPDAAATGASSGRRAGAQV